jgi:peptidoglycan/LPS O-acetylase OafA/YrhL
MSPAGEDRSGKRLHNVQLLRFFAAFGVLVSHTADLLLSDRSIIWDVDWTGGVDMFFIISGFIMYYLAHDAFGQPGAAKAFLLRRLIRIAPPYWLFTTLMIVTALVFADQVRNATLEPAQIATSYAFIPWPRGDGKLNPILSQGWTLNYEFFFYAMFSLALLFRRGIWLLAASFIALVLAGSWIPQSWFIGWFYSDPMILEFLFGIAIAALYLSGFRLVRWQAVLLVGMGAMLFTAQLSPYFGLFGRLVDRGGPALLVCAGLMLLPDPQRPGRVGRALRLGGDASYTLYLSHAFVVNAVVLVGARIWTGTPWLVFAAAIAAALLVAVVVYRVIERPMTDALQRWIGTAPLRGAASVAP